MDTLLREPDDIAHSQKSDELSWDAPTGILTHEPERAEPGAEHVWPEVTGNATPTYLHAGVVVAAAAGYAWFLLAFWAAFWGFGYMMLALAVATLISVTMLGLHGGWRRRWAQGDRRGSGPGTRSRSFSTARSRFGARAFPARRRLCN